VGGIFRKIEPSTSLRRRNTRNVYELGPYGHNKTIQR
jgi:hypothetical protein